MENIHRIAKLHQGHAPGDVRQRDAGFLVLDDHHGPRPYREQRHFLRRCLEVTQTAEVFAQPYLEMGVTTYSSAVFNFVPELALRFYNAVRQRDTQVMDGLMKSFYLPLIELRDKKRGYAVSMIKAGADLVGRSAGKVRTPLTELDAGDRKTLADLIAANT